MGEVASPLANIIRKAAEKQVEGPVAKLRKRFTEASGQVFLLCDVSYSMNDFVGNGSMRKCEALQIAVDDVLKHHPKIRVVAFGSIPLELGPNDRMPQAGTSLGSGTDLALALECIRPYKPRKTIIITDGMPDDEDAAEEAAEQLTGAIDTIYCGPEEHPAIHFLKGLAKKYAGTSHMVFDGYREISETIRGLLPPPATP